MLGGGSPLPSTPYRFFASLAVNMMNFSELFQQLTGKQPFPWQQALYDRFAGNADGGIPQSCSLPTGMGKTSVVAVWLIAIDTRQYPEALILVTSHLLSLTVTNLLVPPTDISRTFRP